MVSGDGNNKLAQLLLRLSQAERDLSPELAKALIPDTKRLVQSSFREQMSPEGVSWAPKKDGTALKLSDLKDSLSYSTDPDGMTITVPPPASYHQQGTNTIPARPFLPVAGIPDKWMASYRQEAKKLLKKKLAGK